MSAIRGDYVAGFLGSSEKCNWDVDAFDVIKTKNLQRGPLLGWSEAQTVDILMTSLQKLYKLRLIILRARFVGKAPHP